MSPNELLREKREDILRLASKRGASNVEVDKAMPCCCFISWKSATARSLIERAAVVSPCLGKQLERP